VSPPEHSIYGEQVSQPEPLWGMGAESARSVTALGFAVALTAAWISIQLGDAIGLFYDLVFVTLCLALAWLARPADFGYVATLPPIITAAVLGLVAAVQPLAVADPGDGFVQALVTALVHHSLGFLVGFLVCLACLGLRMREASAPQP
jgi:type III secretory pathway component EscS